MKKFTRAYPLLFMLACSCFGQIVTAQHFNFKPLSVQEGLAQSQVYSILQDSRGYIWMGTRGGGLSRYDGTSFTNYSSRQGLANNYIQSLFEDKNGLLWIGTSGGLSSFNGVIFTTYQPLPGIETGVETILEDAEGKLWIGTENGLFFLKDDTLRSPEFARETLNRPVYDLAIDAQGALWGGTDAGLFRYFDDSLSLFNRSNGLVSNLVTRLEFDQFDRLWISLYGHGLQYFEEGQFVRFPYHTSAVVLDILPVGSHELWMGTLDTGVILYDIYTDKVKVLSQDNGLPNNQVRALANDDWGNVWVGTSGSGAAKYSGQAIQFFNRDNGLPGRRVYAVGQDQQGVYWLGMDDAQVASYTPDNGEGFAVYPHLFSGKVKVIAPDSIGRVWVGTEGGGVSILSEDTLFSLTRSQGLSGDWIKAILHLADRRSLVATTEGISILTPLDSLGYDYDIRIINHQKGLSEDRITDLDVDSLGRIWFSTTGSGIGVILDDETVLNFDKSMGLSSNSVRSIAIDAYQWLWIGTAGGGVSMMDLKADTLQIKPLGDQLELGSDNIYFLQFDGGANLWVGTESGVDKIMLNDFRTPIEIQHFGKQEGLLGIETCTNASIRDRENNLWFGTIDGLAKADPNLHVRNPFPPRTRITQINLFYEPLSSTSLASFVGDWGQVNDTLVLTYTQNHLSFDFLGVDHLDPEGVRYQWQLFGEETAWSPLTSQTRATFSNLRPGEYSFRLRACNDDGVCSDQNAIVNFVILAPFWQKKWFLILCALGGLMAISLVFFLRVRNLKARNKRKTERILLEKGMIELEQKALRLQMNPHFIFNTLNTIQALIATQDAKTARLYLSKFSKLMRETLENSRESLIAVDDEVSALKHYLDLEKFGNENVFEYDIEIGEGAEHYMIPPLLVQPFVENGIIHGLIPKGGDGKIHIRFIDKGTHLLIEIEDNGIGRRKAAEHKAQKANYHKSTALQVTQERLDMINQNGSSSIEFIDLIVDGEASGTLVKLRVEN